MLLCCDVGRVPAGDATDQPGRLGGPLSGPGAQRTPSGDRQPGGQGDPQLRPGGQGRSRRPGPTGRVDLAVPRARPGGGRGRRGGGGDRGVPPAGRGVDAGSLWERLAIGAAIRRAAEGRQLDGQATERVIFALVAQRALEPGSKLAATGWVVERVAIEGCSGFSDDAAYAAMDFLLDALEDIAAEVFASVAHLLNLDLDIVFVDTTSTYFEVEHPDELAELQEGAGDDEQTNPAEAGIRAFGHSKDHRDDLPQVVIAMAVTRDGVTVRCWTFP